MCDGVPVSPCVIDAVGEEELRDIELEVESEEARKPCGLRDLGAPSAEEVKQHNITHLPYR